MKDEQAAAEIGRLYPNVELRTGGFDPSWFQSFALIVVSPGVALREPAIAEAAAGGIDVIGDVELFARDNKTPVLAITGSNGKTTVTSLLGEMLKAAGVDVEVGGNIGLPVLSMRRDPAPDCYVLELSSFQLESTHSLDPVAATVLNVSMDHMDRYDAITDYAAAKARIFGGQTVPVINRDDAEVVDLVWSTLTDERRYISFGAGLPERDGDYGLEFDGRRQWIRRGQTRLIDAASLRLKGRHNLTNVMAAMALAESFGISPDKTLNAVRDFSGLEHRMELVADSDGIQWINDSKGTNVGATVAAIEGTSSPVILIAGGQGKDADFEPLAAALRDKARAVVLIGEDADLIEAAIGSSQTVVRTASLEAAIEAAAAQARDGDVVLFSPACASFDMFDSYEARGDAFRDLVKGRCK